MTPDERKLLCLIAKLMYERLPDDVRGTVQFDDYWTLRVLRQEIEDISGQ